MKIGVLALQGDFYMHLKRLQELGVDTCEVKTPGDLEKCAGLIIPGGESTTLAKLLENIGLSEAIPQFIKNGPVFGTCAGAILLGSEIENQAIPQLGLIEMRIERNAYGRQIDSFIDQVEIMLDAHSREVEGVFIRAPRILSVGKGVKVLGYHGGEIVMAESGNVLVATFHPELSSDTTIHEYFINKIGV